MFRVFCRCFLTFRPLFDKCPLEVKQLHAKDLIPLACNMWDSMT